VKRGLLGVVMQDLTPSLADAFGISGQKGAVVSQVIPGSAAKEKGMEEGDVIVRFNDIPVESGADLRNAVGLLRAGSKAEVQFYRNGKLKKVTVKIKPLDEFTQPDGGIVKRLHGARFQNVVPNDDVDSGVEVTRIEPGSEADDSGLQVGDVIVSINRKDVSDLEDMKKIVKESEDVLLMKLIRNGRALFLVIQ